VYKLGRFTSPHLSIQKLAASPKLAA